jgi:hypothetical protein
VKRIFLFLLAFFASCSFGFTEEISKVRWATPEWKNYTNLDGSGFYNELISRIFEKKQIKLHQIYVPWKRALMMVERGDADMTGAANDPNTKYTKSKYSLYKSSQSVLFKKTTIPKWHGIKSLQGLRGIRYRGYNVWIPSYLEGREIRTRLQAAKSVIMERDADYYFDNHHQMTATLKQVDIPIIHDEYQLEVIYTSEMKWLFHPSKEEKKSVQYLFKALRNSIA